MSDSRENTQTAPVRHYFPTRLLVPVPQSTLNRRASAARARQAKAAKKDAQQELAELNNKAHQTFRARIKAGQIV